jgi:hypothetical protein
MNTPIVLIAQQFCAEHFCDNNLEMDSYMLIVDRYLERFNTPEEKVQFLIEVKRIGRMFISETLKKVNETELFDLSQQAHWIG